ncbi:biorientation of chromosomes in cell division protein 1-like 1 isoform X2 [Denticeps clupeoides]|uniref:biorientation of chromosomes in cell division protein 1-like 1 isoform X2 n=1 Tax=Denticeps clupeoides TaxID=299321 RepID=UPI0010A4B7F7|nr:biorientation of chromosomes in cell division protein 1-like 1 isoform X2 [Denticeps clupeoides]
MAGLPPGDPQLVSMIVHHLKTQGLFDQFRRDCLADVDTKPAYLNLRQRVDNFVSNHLSNHTWSPHLNKNQLRNNIRQLVLQSGMLEQGVDRIVAQVVDPKIQHIFRPQVERVVREFVSPGSHAEEPVAYPSSVEEWQEMYPAPPGVLPAPGTSSAVSILGATSSLNQEAAVPSLKSDALLQEAELEMEGGEQEMSLVEEGEEEPLGPQPQEEDESNDQAVEMKGEEEEEEKEEVPVPEATSVTAEIKVENVSEGTEIDGEAEVEEVKMEEAEDHHKEDIKEDGSKDKSISKASGMPKEEVHEQETRKASSDKQHIQQKARERLKEEYSLEDSDLEGLSDITVSSVHTSDLSSFEGESDEEPPPSDTTEEGEITSEDENAEKKPSATEDEETKERKPRAGRQAYVHKPFLYSRYYSDSDDEVTVEQRRRSAAKDKEERLLKRQQNRERLEEKRRQKAEEKKTEDISPSLEAQKPRAKEARKEKKVLEKKVALSRRRKRDSRKEGDHGGKKKGDTEVESVKRDEGTKPGTSKVLPSKMVKKVQEASVPEDGRQRKSSSVSEDTAEPKKVSDKNRTHSFILDLEQGSEELLRQRSSGKFDRKKEQHLKERKERSLSDDRAKLKQRPEKNAGQADEGVEKKVNVEKKCREARFSVSEGSAAEDGGFRTVTPKKSKAAPSESTKEKGKEKDRDKEKIKGEKNDLTQKASSEERSDQELGSEATKKKDKVKEVLKRSKSVTEAKSAEKVKSRSESKDSAPADKSKVDVASTHHLKVVGEVEGDLRASRDVEPGLKSKLSSEKLRSKSKEETKSQLSYKKVQGQESKVKAMPPISRSDSAKEKKETLNEELVSLEEPLVGKSKETKATKKTNEKKPKESQKKSEDMPKAEDTPDASTSLAAAETPVTEADPQPEELDGASAPTMDPSTAAVSGDAFDAIRDITPEPEEEDHPARLHEFEEGPRPVPAEADALLSLMEVCSSAERSEVEQEASQRAELSPREADLMKEAALTLLSMDPDTTVSPAEVEMAVSEAGFSSEDHEQLMETSGEGAVIETAAPLVVEPKEVLSPNCVEVAAVVQNGEGNTEDVPAGQNCQKTPEAADVVGTDVDELTSIQRASAQTPPPPADLGSEFEPASAKPERSISEEPAEPEHSISEEPAESEQSIVEEPFSAEPEQSISEERASAEPEQSISEERASAEPEHSMSEEPAESEQSIVQEPSSAEPEQSVSEEPAESEQSIVEEPFSAEPEQSISAEPEYSMSEEPAESEQSIVQEPSCAEPEQSISAEPASAEPEHSISEEPAESEQSIVQEPASAEPEQSVSEEPASAEPEQSVSEEPASAEPEQSVSEEPASAEPQRSVSEEPASAEPQRSVSEEPASAEPEQCISEEPASAEPSNQEAEGIGPEDLSTRDQGTPVRPASEEAGEGPTSRPQETHGPEDKNPEAAASDVTEPVRGRRARLMKRTSSASKSDGPEEERGSDLSEVDDKITRRGRHSSQSSNKSKSEKDCSGPSAEEHPEDGKSQKVSQVRGPRRGRSKINSAPGRQQEAKTEDEPQKEVEKPEETVVRRGRRAAAQTQETGRLAAKRKRSEDTEDSAEDVHNAKMCPDAGQKEERSHEDNVSQSDGQDEVKDGCQSQPEAENEEPEKPQKKTPGRGRPSKASRVSQEDAEKSEKVAEETEEELQEGDEEEETKSRATTRSASRLEAEKNKPSKPSTRAVRKLTGREEGGPAARGGRGPTTAATRGGRKRESSPPTPRTRGGQRSEEPPAKRAKR